MNFSLHYFIKLVWSTQSLTVPLGLGTGTRLEHHVAGTVTGEMTPCWSIESNSCLTVGSSG